MSWSDTYNKPQKKPNIFTKLFKRHNDLSENTTIIPPISTVLSDDEINRRQVSFIVDQCYKDKKNNNTFTNSNERIQTYSSTNILRKTNGQIQNNNRYGISTNVNAVTMEISSTNDTHTVEVITPLTSLLLDTPSENTPVPIVITPAVKLPSPYDIYCDRPTPVEKIEDITTLREALLQSPLEFPGKPIERQTGGYDHDEEISSLCKAFSVTQKMFKSSLTLTDTNPVVNEKSLAIQQQQQQQLPIPTINSDKLQNVPAKPKKYQRKLCSVHGCKNLSRSLGRCKAHGGGKRCSVEGCTRASQTSNLCISHGGGKRCTVENCNKAAQSRGMCKAHGGGVRCCVDGCQKSSQGDGYCRIHGGGKRCAEEGCSKWAQRGGKCMAHSGGKYGNSYRGRLQKLAEGEAVA